MERSGNADARSCYASSGFRRLLRTKSRRDRAPTPAIRIRNLRAPSLLHRINKQRTKPIRQVCKERDEIIAARRMGEAQWPVRSLFLIECRFKLTELLTTRAVRVGPHGPSQSTVAPNERPLLCSYHRNQRPLWTTPATAFARFLRVAQTRGHRRTVGNWDGQAQPGPLHPCAFRTVDDRPGRHLNFVSAEQARQGRRLSRPRLEIRAGAVAKECERMFRCKTLWGCVRGCLRAGCTPFGPE